MKARNNKHIENILDAILENFDLSVNEEDIIESFLILLKDGDIKKLKQVEHLLNEEFDELLETIPDDIVEDYCERELGMVTHKYMNDVLNEDYDFSLENLDVYEHCQLLESKGYEVIKKETTSIVEDMQMEEMKELFLNLSCAEKEDLLNKLRK